MTAATGLRPDGVRAFRAVDRDVGKPQARASSSTPRARARRVEGALTRAQQSVA
jgi:hypothetical protein